MQNVVQLPRRASEPLGAIPTSASILYAYIHRCMFPQCRTLCRWRCQKLSFMYFFWCAFNGGALLFSSGSRGTSAPLGNSSVCCRSGKRGYAGECWGAPGVPHRRRPGIASRARAHHLPGVTLSLPARWDPFPLKLGIASLSLAAWNVGRGRPAGGRPTSGRG